MADLGRLQRRLGYEFREPELLELALTHRSAGRRNNERLEFLGDSVLNHIIAESVYHRFPDASEGDLSRVRSSLVRGEALAQLAGDLELGDYLKLGAGERKSGGHRRASILADALEAVAGAILLDGGIGQCRGCVLDWYGSQLDELTLDHAEKDPKTRLQELVQGSGDPLPEYLLLSVDGEDHAQVFQVACRLLHPALVVEGRGSSRRKAEQAAARAALKRLAQRER